MDTDTDVVPGSKKKVRRERERTKMSLVMTSYFTAQRIAWIACILQLDIHMSGWIGTTKVAGVISAFLSTPLDVQGPRGHGGSACGIWVASIHEKIWMHRGHRAVWDVMTQLSTPSHFQSMKFTLRCCGLVWTSARITSAPRPSTRGRLRRRPHSCWRRQDPPVMDWKDISSARKP